MFKTLVNIYLQVFSVPDYIGGVVLRNSGVVFTLARGWSPFPVFCDISVKLQCRDCTSVLYMEMYSIAELP